MAAAYWQAYSVMALGSLTVIFALLLMLTGRSQRR